MEGKGFCYSRNVSLAFALWLLSLPEVIRPTCHPHTSFPYFAQKAPGAVPAQLPRKVPKESQTAEQSG